MSFDTDREAIREAIKQGWPGKEPSIMGGFYADIAAASAKDYLLERALATASEEQRRAGK